MDDDRRGIPEAPGSSASNTEPTAIRSSSSCSGPLFLFLVMNRLPSKNSMPFAGSAASSSTTSPSRLSIALFALTIGLQGLFPHPHSHPARRRLRGDMALLRPAPVRSLLLGPQRRLGLRRSGPLRLLLLQASGCASVDLGQHRPPPRPSPPSSDSQLQSPRLPRRRPRAAPQGSPDHLEERAIGPPQPLGRGGQAAHRLQGAALCAKCPVICGMPKARSAPGHAVGLLRNRPSSEANITGHWNRATMSA